MSPLVPGIERSPLAFVLILGLMFVLLVVSDALDGRPTRHAPNATLVSAAALVVLGLVSVAGAPVSVHLLVVVVWAVALGAYEAGWRGWRRLHRRG
ncbi:MAG TPA: hypothetical protein VGE02_11970 [Gemmatimonadales bacterium]